MKIIDPYKIKISDLPLFVLSDNMRGFFSFGIKTHTDGNYSHIMTMTSPNYFDTQVWIYKQVPISAYMKRGYRLKFWKYNGFSLVERMSIIEAIRKDLKAPLWERTYDILGIVGQFVHLRWINIPWKNFCSERVAKYLRMCEKLREQILVHPSPADLNRLFKDIIEFECLGYWIMED